MKPTIYFRKSCIEAGELEAAQKYFNCVFLLSDIKKDDFIIYRYSLFPFALDQEKEILNIGAKPIQTYGQHRYAADLQNWVLDLKEMTPNTWDNLVSLPDIGPFVLKGETNSRKSYWLRDMYCETKKEAINIAARLSEDGLIGDQKIYIRQYIPLKIYLTGLGGIPITKEFRFFVAFGEILCGGYYWANYLDDLPEVPNVNDVPKEFLIKAINRVKDKINFFAIDVAQKEDGDWIIIEINDGCCSGLSCNDPDELYCNFHKVLDGNRNR